MREDRRAASGGSAAAYRYPHRFGRGGADRRIETRCATGAGVPRHCPLSGGTGGGMTDAPAFPPLMAGHPVDAGIDPFEKACAMAALGCDAGLIVHNVAANRLAAALVMAPEVPLEQAMAMLPLCGVGFQNALGALGPPEVAVHLEWAGGLRVNGATCGRLRALASTNVPAQSPEWLVVGLELPLVLAATQ